MICSMVLALIFVTIPNGAWGLFGTNKFFFYHDSSTRYTHDGASYEARVACWEEPMCNITVRPSWNKKVEYGCIHESRIRFKDGCPPIVCDRKCNRVVMDSNDKCPICLCKDHYTREPCYTLSDCPRNARECKKGVCHYTKRANQYGVINPFCQLQSDCPPFRRCNVPTNECIPDPKIDFHIRGKYCSFDSDCPSVQNSPSWYKSFKCRNKACMTVDKFCANQQMCRQSETCDASTSKCKSRTTIYPARYDCGPYRNRKCADPPTTTMTTTTTTASSNDKCDQNCWFYQTCRPNGVCWSIVDEMSHGTLMLIKGAGNGLKSIMTFN